MGRRTLCTSTSRRRARGRPPPCSPRPRAPPCVRAPTARRSHAAALPVVAEPRSPSVWAHRPFELALCSCRRPAGCLTPGRNAAAPRAGACARRRAAGAHGVTRLPRARAPGLAVHPVAGPGELPARVVGHVDAAGPGRHALPVHAHAVLPGRALARLRARVPAEPGVLPADAAHQGARPPAGRGPGGLRCGGRAERRSRWTAALWYT